MEATERKEATMTAQGDIYYTGDMANREGWFRITGRNGSHVDLVEVDGDRTMRGIFAAMIGDVYHGHTNPRFITRAAYNTYFEERFAELGLGRYAVKCDDCRQDIRRTDSIGESARGGYCEDCRPELN